MSQTSTTGLPAVAVALLMLLVLSLAEEGPTASVVDESLADLEKCEGFNTAPIKNELRYTGPDQKITREGKMNFRCFQGQHYEDLYMVQNYLHNVGSGFFIELGALDGYSYSVTYFFEQFLKWDGLLIEASPKNAALFKSRMRKMKSYRRRKVEYLVAAACNEPKPLTYVAKEGTGAGIFEFMPESEQKRVLKEGCPAMNTTEYENTPRVGCAMIPIQCIHLGNELKKRQISHIDLFVLDVQGAELGVMQTLDLKATPVRYFLIELDGTMPSKDAAVRCILRRNGYIPYGRLDLNEVWALPSFPVSNYTYTTPNKGWLQCFKGDFMKNAAPLSPPDGHPQQGGGGDHDHGHGVGENQQGEVDSDFGSGGKPSTAAAGGDTKLHENAKGEVRTVLQEHIKVHDFAFDEELDVPETLLAVLVMLVVMCVFIWRVWSRQHARKRS